MRYDTTYNTRVREIGREIFELADAARPRPWDKAWWLDKAMGMLDGDDQLRARAFEFVDCLPALRTPTDITRHLAEYFEDASLCLPKLFRAAWAPGPLYELRSALIGRAAHIGAVQMAGRFISGHNATSVIQRLGRLRRDGMAFTLDVLGESTTSDAQAERYAQVYHDLIDRLSPLSRTWSEIPIIDRDAEGAMPRVNLSIKLSGLDPFFDAIDPDRAIREVAQRLRPLFRHARSASAFVNIDMESFKHRDLTLELFKRILMEDEFRDWTDVGIVIQAYLRDAECDLEGLLEWGRRRGHGFAIRLVKGAYWDAETASAVRNYSEPPVWTRKWQSDACFERMTRRMLEHANLIRPAFASHNVRSLAVVLATAERLEVTANRYEVQTLFGMGDPLKTAMVKMGRCVRVYCPYGDLMPGMGYLIRRLLENTSNEGFLKQSYGDRGSHERLLMDPTIAKPPSQPLAARNYRDTDTIGLQADPEAPMSTFTNASDTNFTLEANRSKLRGAIDYVRGESGRAYPLIIDGQPVSTDTWFDSLNPSHPVEVVGRVALGTTAHADQAVSTARRAFASWRSTRASERASRLRQVADRIEMRRFELAATIILEVGKPWREADGDVTEAVDHWRYYADQIERIESRPRLRNIPGENNMLTYAPKGVCAVISPWAFPLAILSGMTGAALAAGNTVVIKPARPASVVAAKLVDIILSAGLPQGAVNLVSGVGGTVGRHLVAHRDVNIVAFTGSGEVGTDVIGAGAVVHAGQGFIKKMIVEMGGQNAIIVDDDADLDGAVQAIIESALGYAGQKCSSCSRVIVLDGVYDALSERLRDAARSVPIGPATEPSTLVGPVIDEAARSAITKAIDQARQESRLLVEVPLPSSCGDGFFVAPAIFSDVAPEARLAQEETMGPVLAVIRAKDFTEALKIANGTRYALTGGLYSRSPVHIERARQDFAVGNLYVNRRITGSQVDSQPFGGFKLSGTGVKAGSPDYLHHFMDARCITENTTRSGFVPTESRTRAL